MGPRKPSQEFSVMALERIDHCMSKPKKKECFHSHVIAVEPDKFASKNIENVGERNSPNI